jgi:2-phospho-L-lactate guanylyltransferase
MDIWALLPIKPLASAKSRLAPVLNTRQRSALALSMLEHTLDTLSGWDALAGTLLVSADPQVWKFAAKWEIVVCQEPDVPGLNESLARATIEASRRGARSILVVAGDLPLLDRPSLSNMLTIGDQAERVVIAPDRSHTGTNALLSSPVDVIQYCFGPGSFHKHIQEAHRAHTPVFNFFCENLALDIDLPEDLKFVSDILQQIG